MPTGHRWAFLLGLAPCGGDLEYRRYDQRALPDPSFDLAFAQGTLLNRSRPKVSRYFLICARQKAPPKHLANGAFSVVLVRFNIRSGFST